MVRMSWRAEWAAGAVGVAGDDIRALCHRRKKTRPKPRLPERETQPTGLQRADVRRLQPLLALGDVEFNALVFLQGLEARSADFAEVGEQVIAAVVLSDEAEALAFVEPLDGAGLVGGGHGISL